MAGRFNHMFDIVNRETVSISSNAPIVTDHIITTILPRFIDEDQTTQLNVQNRIKLRTAIAQNNIHNSRSVSHDLIDDIVVIIDCLVMGGHLQYAPYKPRAPKQINNDDENDDDSDSQQVPTD